MYYIGIDPGITGAFCVINENQEIIENSHFVVDSDNLINFNHLNCNINDVACYFDSEVIAIIEKPFILSSQRGNEKIWRNYQSLWLAFNKPLEVRPQEWKKALGVPKGLNKQDSINYQFETFCSPEYNWFKTTKSGKTSIQLDDGKIDAYCIALFALLTNKKK